MTIYEVKFMSAFLYKLLNVIYKRIHVTMCMSLVLMLDCLEE